MTVFFDCVEFANLSL